MKLRWIILAGLLTIFSTPASAQSEPIPLTAYWEILDSLQIGLESNSLTSEALINRADQLESIQSSILPDGREINIDHAYLINLLRFEPAQTDRVLNILQAFQTRRDLQPQQTFSSWEIETLSKILSQPSFQWTEDSPNPLYKLWINFTNWLLRLFSRLFPGLENANQLINTSLLVIFGLILGVIFWFIYRNTIPNLTKVAELDPINGEIHQLNSAQALVKAREKSTQGDQRNAVRYLYLSARLTLIERGLLKSDQSRTNKEVIHELAGSPEVSNQFKEITTVFDRVWYGYHVIDAESFEVYFQQVDQLNQVRERFK
jgi:hypothetical protein